MNLSHYFLKKTNMKHLFLSLLIAAPAIGFAQQKEFTLKGRVGELNVPAKAYLNYIANGKQVMDSAVINNGTFTFKGMVAEPVKARLIVDHHGSGLKNMIGAADNVILYLEPAVIAMSSKDSVKHVVFSGSAINTDCAAFLKSISTPLQEVKAVNIEFGNATDDERQDADFKNRMKMRFNKANASIKDLQVSFIKSHPDSYFSLLALIEYSQNNQNMSSIETLFQSLSAKVRTTPAGETLLKEIANSRSKP